MKILFWVGSGLVMAYKRLKENRFTWPTIQDGAMTQNEDERQLADEDLETAVARSRPAARAGSAASVPAPGGLA